MRPESTPADQASSAERTPICDVEPFSGTLARHGLELTRGQTSTLQINVGLMCNQACRHCHLEAGPNRSEVMSRETIDQVVAYAGRTGFQVVDITGGAPEMNAHLGYLIENIASLTPRLMLRANLTALAQHKTDYLLRLFRAHRVVIVASFPSVNPSQTDSQRGAGVFEKSITMLKKLNEWGYGRDGTGLELNLVSNPTGAFLAASQSQAEKKFRHDLARKWGIFFNNLFTFANVPLGRFLTWLRDSGNLEEYMQRLSSRFNPCAVENVMCRTFVSVSWDGYLYDCDFNQARGLRLAGGTQHVSHMTGFPEAGVRIAVGDHCYACTAGSGFTCCGSIEERSGLSEA